MTQKTLSVVIPTYNEEDYIKACLDSVFAQTVLPAEVIVVDNNSTDKTKQIVSKYKKVKLLNESRQGQVYARITGFNAAKSHWLATLDADSVIDKTWIEEMMLHASSKHDAFSSYVYTNEGFLSGLVSRVGNFFFFAVNKLISGQYLLLGSNFVMTKKLWLDVRDHMRLRTDLWEDLDLGLIAASKGYKISLLKRQNVQISIRGSSIGLVNIYKRLLGWPKTYWPYKKIAAVLSVVFLNVAFVIIVLLKIPVYAGYKVKKKYSGWS